MNRQTVADGHEKPRYKEKWQLRLGCSDEVAALKETVDDPKSIVAGDSNLGIAWGRNDPDSFLRL